MKDNLEHIMDYDIVVDDPKLHTPYAMFCSTIDAGIFKDKMKERYSDIEWQVIKLSEWVRQYEGGDT